MNWINAKETPPEYSKTVLLAVQKDTKKGIFLGHREKTDSLGDCYTLHNSHLEQNRSVIYWAELPEFPNS